MAEIVYIINPSSVERNKILDMLASEPVTVVTYDCADQFLSQLAAMASGCILVPVDLPGIGVRALIGEILRRDLALAVIVIGRSFDLTTAVELIRLGASDFLENPFSDRRLRLAVRRAIGANP